MNVLAHREETAQTAKTVRMAKMALTVQPVYPAGIWTEMALVIRARTSMRTETSMPRIVKAHRAHQALPVKTVYPVGT